MLRSGLSQPFQKTNFLNILLLIHWFPVSHSLHKPISFKHQYMDIPKLLCSPDHPSHMGWNN